MQSRPPLPKGTPEARFRTLETAPAPPPPRLPVGAVFRDRFRVTGTIEAGPVASIYRAKETATGRRVAVKVWHKVSDDHRSRAERFQWPATRDGAAPGQLPSSFVAVRDCALTADGQLFLVTELVDCPSLRELVETAPGLEPGRAVALARRVGEALAIALDRGFPELPITPANVVVDADAEDSVKILGSEALVLRRLGLADWPAEALPRDAQYAAPEELAGEPPTERSAVYRFGLLLRFLLHGTLAAVRPMPAGPFERLLAKLRLRRQPPSVLSALDRLTAWMTDPDPAARPTNLTVLSELWRASCRLEAADWPKAPRHRWVLVAVPALLGAGALIAWLVVGSGRSWPSATPAPPLPAPPLTPPPATMIAPSRATPPPPLPTPTLKPAPPLTSPATVIASPRRTPPPPLPAPTLKPAPRLTSPATVIAAEDAVSAAVDPVPPTAAQPIQRTEPRTGEQRTDPGAIIDWLFRKSSQGDQ
jgi:eukaryotic-like serine/threonine-protein kinase